MLADVFGFDKYSEVTSEFVELYYRTSPPIADCIRHREGLRAVVRWGLAPIVFIIANFGESLVLVISAVFVLGCFRMRKRLGRRNP